MVVSSFSQLLWDPDIENVGIPQILDCPDTFYLKRYEIGIPMDIGKIPKKQVRVSGAAS